ARRSRILLRRLAPGRALVPLVAGGDVPGRGIACSMAFVRLGGLSTSTLRTLFVVPSLYLPVGNARNATPSASLAFMPPSPGVSALVTWDQDHSADTLDEAELAFYAQDKDGNVWYMGEYPEAYQNGKLVEAPTWIQGFKGARAGIMMQANPQIETPSYSEGWG